MSPSGPEGGPAPDPATAHVFGVLTVGGAQVALPLTELREVVSRPAELLVLPVRCPGLLGAVDLRHQLIPVVDLRELLGLPPEPRADQVVMIAVRDGRALGLVADAVSGVCPVDRDGLRPLLAEGGDPLLLSHTFVRTEDESMVGVLDLAAVMGLPGLPLVEDRAPAAGTDPAGTDGTRSLLLARCGRIALGVDIEHIHATLPYLDVRPSPLAHGSCRGVIDYGDVEVPVLDPLDLMGLGLLDRERVQGLVFRTDQGLVVLLLTDILEIVQVRPEQVLPLPPLAVHRPELLEGVLHDDALGEFLVVRAEEVLAEPGLQTLSRLNTGGSSGGGVVLGLAAGDTRGDATGDDRQDVYLTYSVGPDQATPLSQVLEILPYPAAVAPLDDGLDAVLGLVTHREDVIPLVCLATLAGRPERPDPAGSCVLVVAAEDGTRIGLVVLGLRAIERSIWEEDPADVRSRPGADPVQRALTERRLIRIAGGVDQEPRMLPRVDLEAVATALAEGYRGALRSAGTGGNPGVSEQLRAG